MQVNTRNMLSYHISNLQFSDASFLIIESSKMKNELLHSEIIQRNLLTGISDSWHACTVTFWVNYLAVAWAASSMENDWNCLWMFNSQIIPSNLLTGMSDSWYALHCSRQYWVYLLTVLLFCWLCWHVLHVLTADSSLNNIWHCYWILSDHSQQPADRNVWL